MPPISTACAVHTEDCEGWWLSNGYSSVVQYWLLKPGALGSNPGFSASSILHQTCQYVSLCIYQKAGASTRKKIKKIRKRLNPRVNPFFAPNALASFNLSSYLHRQNIIVTIVTNEARLQVCCSSSFSSTVLTPARSLYPQQEYKVC